jgi:hypothetical protein
MMEFCISYEDPHECHAATHIGIHTSIHAVKITVLTCIWLKKYRAYYIYTNILNNSAYFCVVLHHHITFNRNLEKNVKYTLSENI